MSTDKHLEELADSARRAGNIVTEHIDQIVAVAERRADEIRDEAQRDADNKRRAAIGSAQILLERISALERPLADMVLTIRGEMERVTAELENGHHTDSHATAIPAELNRNHHPDVEHEAPAASEESEPEPEVEEQPELEHPEAVTAEHPSTPEEEAQPAEPSAGAAASSPGTMPAAEGAARRGLFGRKRAGASEPKARREPKTKRAKKGAFITREGHCAVCQRTFMAGSAENLEMSGWAVSGNVGLCPECQDEDWQLPEGARLPFRRGGN